MHPALQRAPPRCPIRLNLLLYIYLPTVLWQLRLPTASPVSHSSRSRSVTASLVNTTHVIITPASSAQLTPRPVTVEQPGLHLIHSGRGSALAPCARSYCAREQDFEHRWQGTPVVSQSPHRQSQIGIADFLARWRWSLDLDGPWGFSASPAFEVRG